MHADRDGHGGGARDANGDRADPGDRRPLKHVHRLRAAQGISALSSSFLLLSSLELSDANVYEP